MSETENKELSDLAKIDKELEKVIEEHPDSEDSKKDTPVPLKEKVTPAVDFEVEGEVEYIDF